MQRDVKIGLVIGVAILAIIIIAMAMQDDAELRPHAQVVNAVPPNFSSFPGFSETPATGAGTPPTAGATSSPPAAGTGSMTETTRPSDTGTAATPTTTPPAAAGAVVGETTAPPPGTGTTPEPKVHVVAKGDTLWGLGVKYYGDGTKGKIILQANKAVIADPEVLRIGQKLIIPPAVAPVTQGASARAGDEEHTLTKKDTLWSLAQKYYGDGAKWKRILQANQDIIKDERHLPVGKTIVIPRAD